MCLHTHTPIQIVNMFTFVSDLLSMSDTRAQFISFSASVMILCFDFTYINIAASYLSLFDKIVLKIFSMECIPHACSSGDRSL